MTRFHTDPRILSEKADELWISYLKTYRLSAERRAFLAMDGGKAIGAILVSRRLLDGKWLKVFDVVAVSAQARSRAVGTTLIREAIRRCEDPDIPMVVSSQHRNVRAINFYIRNGFCFFEPPRTVFHWWT